jgi:hypothetical protein
MDTHAKKIAESQLDDTPETIDGRGFAEALKVTDAYRVAIARKRLIGGTEDCLDAVRVARLTVAGVEMTAGPDTRTYITAKGSGLVHHYRDITFRGRPRCWSVSLGDWTLYNHDPSLPPMREVILHHVRREDGKRWILLQLYCRSVRVVDCPGMIRINLFPVARVWFWLLRKLRHAPAAARDARRDWMDEL